MSWFSILPKSISFVETWIIRLFIFLGVLVIAPWFLLVVYDAILYIVRIATYEVPLLGGRARNRPLPRAPTLSERPSGRPRTFSMGLPGLASSTDTAADAVEGLKRRLDGPGNSSDSSNVQVDE